MTAFGTTAPVESATVPVMVPPLSERREDIPSLVSTFIEQVDFRHVSNGAGAEQLVDPDLKPIRAQEFTLGAEHQLARSMSISMLHSPED